MQGLMQLLDAPRDHFKENSNIFYRKRNRVEFMSDFPEGDKAVSISTMQVHPQGWCIVSRNTTADEQTEWTCVHDIQDLNNGEVEKSEEYPVETDCSSTARNNVKRPIRFLHSQHLNGSSSQSTSENNGYDDNQENSSQSSASDTSNSGLPNTLSDSSSSSRRFAEYEQSRPHAASFHFCRLLFHSGEPNVGQGYIKEQSFSPDGRIIASPFANCVRLLAYDSECHELCDAVPLKPRPLRQVALIAGNKSSVLTSTFSPVQLLYAAGAEDGSISFCSPKL
ncbi:DDB1- and CUL4-associated factor 10 [Elysia marginata]|uniref:DDB1- and CUL4-associated factor 10 n=1 Tax=Elysia marginata TaxID=1093978 RepID=A0AAV4EEG3_9GAST|nr:DDB1- and CUL4-associated factor 10 [Elysia marginata]